MSSVDVVADHGELAGRHAEAVRDRPQRRTRRLADDDRPPPGDLRERRGEHRAAAEDRPVRARVGGHVAAGQQPRAAEHRPGRALERGEVDDVGVRDEHGVDVLVVPSPSRSRSRRGTRAPPRCRTRSSVAPWCARRNSDAAERRQQLVVADVEARVAELGGESGGRDVAAVREEHERPAGRADPLEHLDGAGLDVHVLALSVHERPVDVEHEALDVVKSHGATPRRSSPFCTRSCVIDGRFATSCSSVTTGCRPPARRAATGLDRRGREHRVHLLLRHRQPQQQLLVGDPRAEAGPRALEVQRLEVAELLARAAARGRGRPRRDATGAGGLAVVAEEVADRLVGDVRPALAVDDVPHRLRRDELRDRRDDDRVAHLGAHATDLLEDGVEQLGPAQLVEHPPRRRDHAAGQLVVVVGRVELLRRRRREALARAPSARKCSDTAASASRSSRCE